MTTREYFRSLRADLWRENVHAFVLVDRIADYIVRENNPEHPPLTCCLFRRTFIEWIEERRPERLAQSVVAAKAYRGLLELCSEVERARQDAASRQLGAPEAGALRELYSRQVMTPELTGHRRDLRFHPMAFAFAMAPLDDRAQEQLFDVLCGVGTVDPLARLFAPGRWLR